MHQERIFNGGSFKIALFKKSPAKKTRIKMKIE
jgi:hypothetical protein